MTNQNSAQNPKREPQHKGEDAIIVLTNQVKQLQEALTEKEKYMDTMSKDLNHYRKENVAVKEENKNYKADNKILMNQIDRLTKDVVTPDDKSKIVQER
jgi:soluble cytochrome b562